jgi:hypothetical protein
MQNVKRSLIELKHTYIRVITPAQTAALLVPFQLLTPDEKRDVFAKAQMTNEGELFKVIPEKVYHLGALNINIIDKNKLAVWRCNTFNSLEIVEGVVTAMSVETDRAEIEITFTDSRMNQFVPSEKNPSHVYSGVLKPALEKLCSDAGGVMVTWRLKEPLSTCMELVRPGLKQGKEVYIYTESPLNAALAVLFEEEENGLFRAKAPPKQLPDGFDMTVYSANEMRVWNSNTVVSSMVVESTVSEMSKTGVLPERIMREHINIYFHDSCTYPFALRYHMPCFDLRVHTGVLMPGSEYTVDTTDKKQTGNEPPLVITWEKSKKGRTF